MLISITTAGPGAAGPYGLIYLTGGELMYLLDGNFFFLVNE